MQVAERFRMTAVATALVVATGLMAPVVIAPPAGAAGITTHSWMATEAVHHVEVPELKAVLEAHIDQVYAGAQFPDSGYVPTTVFGEEAHWQRFYDAYADIIRAKPGCGPLTDPDGPCAGEIAHLMGSIAHGMGDEVWDWLFEPMAPDLREHYLPPELAQFQGPGGEELQMDLVAIALYGRVNPDAPPLPSKPDLLAAFEAAGFHEATEEQLDFGQQIQAIIHDVEAAWAPEHIDGLRRAMPYLSANLVSEPGGVDFAAGAIAAEWENMWGRLLGSQPATEVSVTYPADGQRRVPAAGWVREYLPGSHADRGGARTRITAVLTYSTPYVPPEGGPGIPSLLPDGAMTLTERDSGAAVPVMAGYPKIVPYTPDPGEHVIDIQPAADLRPCTWYRVAVTELLLDARQEPVTPHSWDFRTGPTTGGRCDDDPLTEEEHWVGAVYAELLGQEPSPAATGLWTYLLDRDLDRTPVTSALVGSVGHRRRLVQRAYTTYLDRRVDPAGRDFWTARLATTTLVDLRADLIGSDEFLTLAGGTNGGYVAEVYRRVLGREADAAGLEFWTAQLDGGLSRVALARSFLLAPESVRKVVRRTYDRLLDRPATRTEVSAWFDPVAAADERVLVQAIVTGPEYLSHVQPG